MSNLPPKSCNTKITNAKNRAMIPSRMCWFECDHNSKVVALHTKKQQNDVFFSTSVWPYSFNNLIIFVNPKQKLPLDCISDIN
jgi:hypothetical protein